MSIKFKENSINYRILIKQMPSANKVKDPYMHRIACLALGLTSLIAPLGCALCSSPFDNDYVSSGGRIQRLDMRNGRVGSPLSDHAIGGNVPVEEQSIQRIEVQPIEPDYGNVLESTYDTDTPLEFDSETFINTDKEEPDLLEPRKPSNFKPAGKSRIIQVPSGDSFFDKDV